MQPAKIITGTNEEEIWQQVTNDLQAGEDMLEYEVIIDQQSRKVLLDIDIDPGGGFESGYELTRLSAAIQKKNDFRFAIHHQGFIDKMGKFLGMEDVIIGYPPFDEKLVIKTNDAVKVKNVFAETGTREAFEALTDFNMHITHHAVDGEDDKEAFLELEIDRGITDSGELRKLYHAFYSVLSLIDTI